MPDPVVVAVAKVGVALTKVLLRACDNSPGADLVGDGQELVGNLSRALRRTDESKGQIEDRVSQALATRTDAMRERCSSRGVNPDLLSGACTEVKIILEEIADDGALLLSAVRTPESFPETLREYADRRRVNVEAAAEPYFDELVGAVAAEYSALVPWSPRFQIEAFKSILSGIDEIQENSRLSLDAHAVTHDKLDKLSSKLAEVAHHENKPSRVFSSSRPDVATGDRFVARREQQQVNSLIADPTQRRTVLVGMRGCGKTQLAAALAQECEEANWSLVAWVHAGSPGSIKSGLVELAKELKIDTSDQQTEEQIVGRCLNYLRSSGRTDRLIVFDNVEDINHLTGLIPSGDGMRVVATTTNKVGWEDQGWNSIEVGGFDRSDSIKYLLKVTNSDDRDAADTLAERLEDLPLALAQAAATAHNGDLSLARYLDRLDSYGSERAIRPVPGDYYTHDVATALCMTIKDALKNLEDGTKQAARCILGALALLAESGVPTRWLDPMSEEHDEQELQDHDRAEDENAHDALTELIHRSIVQQSSDKATTTLHRLQAEVLRDNWDENETNEASHAAAHILTRIDINNIALADTEERRKDARDLIYQLRSIADQQHSSSLFREEATLEATDHAIYNAGLLGIEHETIALHKAVDILTQVHGKNNETVENVRNDLADACLKRGYMSMERELRTAGKFGRILTLQDDIDGAVMAHLIEASNQESAHKYDRATKEYEHALQACPPATGTNVRYITGIRQALAELYSESNRTEDAIAQYRKAIEESPALRGPGHPLTDILRTRLAALLIAKDEHAEAIQLLNEAYSNLCNTFGKADDLTLWTLFRLCDAQVSIGEHDKAIILLKEVLETQPPIQMSNSDKRVLQQRLAEAHASTGQHDTAVKLLDSMLDELHQQHTTEKTKSNDRDFYIHDLCSIQYQLASILYESETVDELLRATEILEGVISNCEITYGAQHPITMDAHFLLSQVNARISNLRE